MSSPARQTADKQLTMHVVNHIRALIERGELVPGDQLPPEREFARELKISRASLRTGIGYLAALGVLKVRHGVGAFISDGSEKLGKTSLELLGVLPGLQTWQLFEVRMILEGALAALAAERGLQQHIDLLAEEVAEMDATVKNPSDYLIHDVRFHRTIAEAAGNPVLGAIMETITMALYDARRTDVERSESLEESVKLHRGIFQAIRQRQGGKAKKLMERHLALAESAQKREKTALKAKASTLPKRQPRLSGEGETERRGAIR